MSLEWMSMINDECTLYYRYFSFVAFVFFIVYATTTRGEGAIARLPKFGRGGGTMSSIASAHIMHDLPSCAIQVFDVMLLKNTLV